MSSLSVMALIHTPNTARKRHSHGFASSLSYFTLVPRDNQQEMIICSWPVTWLCSWERGSIFGLQISGHPLSLWRDLPGARSDMKREERASAYLWRAQVHWWLRPTFPSTTVRGGQSFRRRRFENQWKQMNYIWKKIRKKDARNTQVLSVIAYALKSNLFRLLCSASMSWFDDRYIDGLKPLYGHLSLGTWCVHWATG